MAIVEKSIKHAPVRSSTSEKSSGAIVPTPGSLMLTHNLANINLGSSQAASSVMQMHRKKRRARGQKMSLGEFHAMVDRQNAARQNASATKIQAFIRGRQHRKKSIMEHAYGHLLSPVGSGASVAVPSGRMVAKWNNPMKKIKDGMSAKYDTTTGKHSGTIHHGIPDAKLKVLEPALTDFLLPKATDTASEKAKDSVSVDKLKTTVANAALGESPNFNTQLYHLKPNLTVGPLTNDVSNDAGEDFDPNYAEKEEVDKKGQKTGHRNWDMTKQSNQLMHIHHMLSMIKDGKHKLNRDGVDFIESKLAAANAEPHGYTAQKEVGADKDFVQDAVSKKYIKRKIYRHHINE